MSTHPYIPLYVDDYEAATAHLTLEEDGVYSRLLRLCWRTPGCSLPNDPAWIARKIRVSADDFERIARPVINEFFSLSRGRYVQRRLKAEYDDISRKKSARKLAGKKGGISKALKAKENSPSNASVLPADTRAFPEPYPEPEYKEANASSVASASPDATELLALAQADIAEAAKPAAWDRDEDFGRLWDMTPPLMRKRAKSKSKAWSAWTAARKLAAPNTILAAFARYKALDSDLPRSGGPGLHFWLKDRTWEEWAPAEPNLQAWSEDRWSVAVRIFAYEGVWDEAVAGPKPGSPGCRAPPAVVRRYGIEPAGPVAIPGAAA